MTFTFLKLIWNEDLKYWIPLPPSPAPACTGLELVMFSGCLFSSHVHSRLKDINIF